MSYIILKCHWRDIIVLNVHAPTEDKIDTKANFYEDLRRMCIQKVKLYMTYFNFTLQNVNFQLNMYSSLKHETSCLLDKESYLDASQQETLMAACVNGLLPDLRILLAYYHL
jgi:hypothetical protein